MKKTLIILLAALLLIGACACGTANTNNTNNSNEAAPEKVTGTVRDFGRFSALVPEGWEALEMGGETDGMNGAIVKGKASEFMSSSSVSITYGLPTDAVFSSKSLSENVKELGEFDLGGRRWSAWSGSFGPLSFSTAEHYGKEGTIFVTLQQLGGELTFDDPEVKAIIESIVTSPTVEADWITIKDGVATIDLPAAEGFEWSSGYAMFTNDVEANCEFVDGKAIITAESGTGGYTVEFDLFNEDQSLTMGKAEVKLGVTDAKVDAVYGAELTMYDEPQSTGFEDDTDYEALAEEYSGTWKDEENGLTLTITMDDSVEHGCLMEIKSDSMQMSASGTIEAGGHIEYWSMTLDGKEVETPGTFNIFEGKLYWGFDDEVIKLANDTPVFVKQ